MSSLNNNKFASLGTLSELTRPVKSANGRAPSSLQSASPPSSHSQQLTAVSPSSLSTEECSSSRYSSLQDTESLKSAILDSFRMHWIQAWSIMEHKILNDITMDDLSSIVNHIEQMISLLVEESSSDIRTINSYCDSNKSSSEQHSSYDGGHHQPTETSSLSPLLDFLFVESILDKVFQWSEMSGEWKFAMYLEQLKLYELLISQLVQGDMILFQQPFFQPLIRLLDALSNSTNAGFSLVNFVEIEKRLVLLLNTLCVAISQNPKLLEVLLVYSNEASRSSARQKKATAQLISIDDSSSPRGEHDLCLCDSQLVADHRSFTFPVFLLLIQFVHREGAIGQQSRDALLLCLSMSRHDERLAYYIVGQTDFCPLLATGLSGLFSSLPRVLIGQSMSVEQFQFKDDLLHDSKEIEQFLKCLDFCNAVAQISHPIIQVQLLNYIYNGFLVSVIGPALHQDVANVSIEDLESMPTYSNTLDEIITTTAYLDLFIRSISEPNLIRIFLEFLCFEQYDNQCIINSLISRISAKSKLSLITLILFKTLLDLNCEDLQFELIFKHLLRGKHLVDAPESQNSDLVNGGQSNSSKANGIQQAISCYQQNWLAISGQKLFSNSLSHYLHSLCPHQSAIGRPPSSDTDSIASLDDLPITCKCHSAYYLNYLDYLNDARFAIEQCRIATKPWKNAYAEPCFQLNDVHEQSIIFCTVEGNLNNNDDRGDKVEEDSRAINELVIKNNDNEQGAKGQTLQSNGLRTKHFYGEERRRKMSEYSETPENGNAVDVAMMLDDQLSTPVIGLFLNTALTRVAQFFENDVLTNLHLTALLTTLCQSPHKLLLSLFFDETLARVRGVPCLLHLLQKLSLDAQNYCDDIANFESMFQSAKINLQSVPIGELNCQLLTGNHHQTRPRAYSAALPLKPTNIESSINKGLGALKSFFRSSNSSKPALSRRDSNASINSFTSHVLEVIPGAVKFSVNQPRPKELPPPDRSMDKLNELIYNLIIFDEFLMELSAILVEQSIGNCLL